MRIKGNDIYMIRGDSETITVSCEENGEKVYFSEGETIHFTVKDNVYSKNKRLQKIITSFVDGEAIIEIDPEDTKGLDFTTYEYDIQYTDKNGRVKTIIPPSNFTVEGEITHE